MRETGEPDRAGDTEPRRIRVATAQPYDVIIGRYLRAELLDAVGSGAVAIVHQPTLREGAEALRTVLEHLGSQAYRIEVPDAEDGKKLAVAGFCWDVLGQVGLDRTGTVIGFGGGAVTDLAGFVGSSGLRGVRRVQVTNTLLARGGASVGRMTTRTPFWCYTSSARWPRSLAWRRCSTSVWTTRVASSIKFQPRAFGLTVDSACRSRVRRSRVARAEGPRAVASSGHAATARRRRHRATIARRRGRAWPGARRHARLRRRLRLQYEIWSSHLRIPPRIVHRWAYVLPLPPIGPPIIRTVLCAVYQ